jgi:hypothetical protein
VCGVEEREAEGGDALAIGGEDDLRERERERGS